MPTYEYECKKCGYYFDVFQNMTDAPVGSCPQCGGAARRLPGAGAGVIFKGSGSHATDGKTPQPRCGRDQPCCGRDEPCNIRPCDK